ncbi:TetR family transcriptional regulator [Mycobacterium nebraskense]|uniref:TetR family transcriptional regulator n=1 Tax=Mycobacterium nebraskense TaxID=244292 RepID=A0A0F5NJN6_9MYCO|nr:TetR family transcriptional regulator [Mycobacterium nebraskense]KKC06438.1 TetR family transcriptional regulator [Mycobacterium nebraskense]KLO46603.1 TetR family transcriptional regulator [Mycobacterium nebraskense]MBI2694875.1 TetR/AcrR family transcriptional regulator [Mycobacterium nebraskense]MCV7116384.1 TetR/AcrR family transcriptional regulator [Mycobacterium nebraskense]ORW13057.1 TetR family transcriptional regulator [Mycobacterium nebraskense]
MPTRSLTPGPRDERGVLAARILAAARDEFAEHGWAGTAIRAVARTADVDPALIYHYFGSKEGLLDAATTPPQKWLDAVAATWATPKADLGRQLIRTVLDTWTDEEVGPILRAVVLTAAHEDKTREKLRLIVERGLIGGSTLGADEDERLRRSGLIATQLIGFALLRYVWKMEPIASMSEDQVVAAIAPNLQRYVEGDIS